MASTMTNVMSSERLNRACGAHSLWQAIAIPALKRWAIFNGPCGPLDFYCVSLSSAEALAAVESPFRGSAAWVEFPSRLSAYPRLQTGHSTTAS